MVPGDVRLLQARGRSASRSRRADVGPWPIFFLMQSLLNVVADERQLCDMLRPVVEALGYELFGLQYSASGRGGVLRLYIDAVRGITADDCERVSRQVGAVLDVEDPIPVHYVLEVSSPGLDRPLFEKQHYERYLGEKVRLRLRTLVDGRRNLTGVLRDVVCDDVIVDAGGELFRIPLRAIGSARLVPEL